MSQTVDPAVSRAKFDRELARFRAHEQSYAARGWWMLKAEFPHVEMGFITANLRPAVVSLAVRFDFTNFDLRPLSVKFIDPFTRDELLGDQLQTKMPRAVAEMLPSVAELIQAYPGEAGFLCLPGVREYHDHPAHSGDVWELHRQSGEGSMLQIAEKIWQYGADPISAMGMKVTPVLQQAMLPS